MRISLFVLTLIVGYIIFTNNYELDGVYYERNPQEYVNRFYNLTRDTELLDFRKKDSTFFSRDSFDFDVNSYFIVLDRLKLLDGYDLDYVYNKNNLGGHPILYVYSENESRLNYYSELLQLSISENDFLNYIEIDDSPDGYIQFIILQNMYNQFYRFWHAYYLDSRVICNYDGIIDLVEMDYFDFKHNREVEQYEGYGLKNIDIKLKGKLSRINPNLKIQYFEDYVSVGVLTFSNWRGLVRNYYKIKRNFPHTIIEKTDSTILEYHCGIQF